MNEATWIPPRLVLHDYARSRAVLVGTWDYAYLPLVPAAEHSLTRFHGLLTGDLCGWPSDRVSVLSNVHRPGDMPDQLITLFEDAADIALFYFVGHGQISQDDNQLCMGLVNSRPEPHHRAPTSLEMHSLHSALRASPATVKILILDCCYSGQAALPKNAIAAAQDQLLDAMNAAGVYTLTASSTFTSAWFETEGDRPQTFFTKYLVDLVESGIPGEPHGLRLHRLFQQLRAALSSDGRPTPYERNVDTAREFVFAHNAAPIETHRDAEEELARLKRLYDRVSARERTERAKYEAEVARLRTLVAQTGSADASLATSRHELETAAESRKRDLDQTTAALAVINEARLQTTEWIKSFNVRDTVGFDVERPLPDDASAAVNEQSASMQISMSRVERLRHLRTSRTRKRIARGVLSCLMVSMFCWLIAALTTPTSLFWTPPRVASTVSQDPPARQGDVESITFAAHNQAVAYLQGGQIFMGTFSSTSIDVSQAFSEIFDEESTVQFDTLALDPTGAQIAIGSKSGEVYLGDVSARKVIATLAYPPGVTSKFEDDSVESLAYSADGKYVAAGNADGNVYVWQLSTLKLFRLAAGTGPVLSVAFSADDKYLASGNSRGQIKLWSTATGAVVGAYSNVNGASIKSVAFGPGTTAVLAAGDATGNVTIMADSSGKVVGSMRAQCGAGIAAITFSPDGRTVVGADTLGNIDLWDAATDTSDGASTNLVGRALDTLAFSPSTGFLFVGGKDGYLQAEALVEPMSTPGSAPSSRTTSAPASSASCSS